MPASYETRHAVEEILTKMTPLPDEKQKRILYGIAVEVLGHVGTATVHEITGTSRNTITNGIWKFYENNHMDNFKLKKVLPPKKNAKIMSLEKIVSK